MKRLLLLALIALLAGVSACGEKTATPGPTSTPEALTSTLFPTETAIPATSAPVVTNTATPAVAPTATEMPQKPPAIADIPVFQGMVMLWHVSGGIAGLCQDLALFEDGQAIYGPCGVLMKGALTETQAAQSQSWQARYRSFDYKFEDNPGRPDNMTTSLIFSGKGNAAAAKAEQEEIVAWVRELYADLTGKQGAITPTPSVRATVVTTELSTGLQTYQGPGFSLTYPNDATLQAVADKQWQLVGPALTLRPGEADWSWSGPAYRMDIAIYDNPKGASSSDWARDYLLTTWREAKAKGEPFTGPVDEEGKIEENRVAQVRLGDKAAFQADWFGGDSWRRAIYLSLGKKTAAFVFNIFPVENYPLADVASDLYGVLLSQISAPGAEGTPDTVPAAQEVRKLTGPGFAILCPAHAVAEEAEDGHWQIVGPEINIRPLEADWTWQGPGYRLDLVLEDNPKGLPAVEWAEEYLLTEWKKAKEANEPFTGPVDAEGKIIEKAAATVQVGKASGYQTDWFGGKAAHRIVYVNAAARILAIHYDIFLAENYPAAPLANAVYALLLASLETGP